MSEILDLDIGNTFVKWRMADNLGRLPTKDFKTADLVAVCDHPPSRVRVASVAQSEQVERLCADLKHLWCLDVEVAKTSSYTAGVTNSYVTPEKMGVDRWLSMVAAFNEFARPCCVVSCGTAITIDYVDYDGRHLGGYILPGVRLLRSGLLNNTERIGVEYIQQGWRHQGPGQDTDTAVAQGLNLILNSVANEVATTITDRLGSQAVLVLCGGDAEHFHQLVGQGLVRPTLVLDGLAYVLP